MRFRVVSKENFDRNKPQPIVTLYNLYNKEFEQEAESDLGYYVPIGDTTFRTYVRSCNVVKVKE